MVIFGLSGVGASMMMIAEEEIRVGGFFFGLGGLGCVGFFISRFGLLRLVM